MKIIKFKMLLLFGGLMLIAFLARGQELFVGTNYHPHDSGPEQWKKDVALMQKAGFKVVRMGHLA